MKPIFSLALLSSLIASSHVFGADRITPEGVEPNGASHVTDISPDGRFVVFESVASNLALNDGNSEMDVFLYDRELGTIEIVSVDSDEFQSESPSFGGTVSNDGRYVAFSALATDLVDGETDDGFVDVYVRDRVAGTTTLATIGDDADNTDGMISGNGAFVLYRSDSATIVAGDANSQTDIFRSGIDGTGTIRVSLDEFGVEFDGGEPASPSISDDGNLVAFASVDPDIVSGDANMAADVFVRNVSGNTTTLVSVSSGPTSLQGDDASTNPVIAGGGQYLAFQSDATNLVEGDENMATDIFIRDLINGLTQIVSIQTNRAQVDVPNTMPTISANGRFIGFSSTSPDFDNRYSGIDPEGFVKDLQTNSIELANRTKNNSQGNGLASVPLVSSNGALAFDSDSSNLVTGDSNGFVDAFYTKGVTPKIVVNNALQASFKKQIKRQIKKAKKKLKRAKKKGKKAKARKFKRKLRKLKRLSRI